MKEMEGPTTRESDLIKEILMERNTSGKNTMLRKTKHELH